jgi:hypothetical protein
MVAQVGLHAGDVSHLKAAASVPIARRQQRETNNWN